MIERSSYNVDSCESGGIGRRTRLRIWRVKPWGFESPLSHQITCLIFKGLQLIVRNCTAASANIEPSC
jgi:hypothetical protein